jgi:hypothetical protein
MTDTRPVIVQAEVPYDSAESTLVPGGITNKGINKNRSIKLQSFHDDTYRPSQLRRMESLPRCQLSVDL